MLLQAACTIACQSTLRICCLCILTLDKKLLSTVEFAMISCAFGNSSSTTHELDQRYKYCSLVPCACKLHMRICLTRQSPSAAKQSDTSMFSPFTVLISSKCWLDIPIEMGNIVVSARQLDKTRWNLGMSLQEPPSGEREFFAGKQREDGCSCWLARVNYEVQLVRACTVCTVWCESL